MKRVFRFTGISIFCIIFLVSSSCKKTEPIPDYPQLIGSWLGSTSQAEPIRFYVDNIKGTLYIESYNISVYTTTGLQVLQNVNPKGIIALAGTTFRISLGTGSSGPAYVDGTFSLDDMSLSGNFAVYGPGNNVDIITGTYFSSKSK